MNKILLFLFKIIFIIAMIGEIIERYNATSKMDWLLTILFIMVLILDFAFDKLLKTAKEIIKLR